MNPSKRFAPETYIPVAVFMFSLLIYLSVRSFFFNFDGVACAIAVELSDFKHLVHGNHLAYGVLAWAFNKSWSLLGYGGRALYPLQVLNGLLGAAGAAVFSSLLMRVGRAPREGLLGGIALALSHAWWFWSLEAQVYMLGALFMTLAAREALDENPRPEIVGLWHGAAILGHVGHAMAAPALLWALTRSRGRKSLPAYLAAAAGLVLAAYTFAALFAVRPASFEEWRVWLLGSAALKPDRSFAWHSQPLAHSLISWLRMCLNIFVAKGPGNWAALLALGLAAKALLQGGRCARFWGLWLAGYAALYLTWEPNTIVYRITDLLAFGALALEGLPSWEPRMRAVVLAAWCAVTGWHNWTTTILPVSRPDGNADLTQATWIGQNTPENAWVLATSNNQVYLPYFAQRKPLNPRYWRNEAEMFARLDTLTAANESIYATDHSLAASGWKDSFLRYGLKDVGHTDILRLYRIKKRSPGS